jgi:Ca-activated chloride channel family protein
MFQFQHIGYLYALAVVPLLLLLFIGVLYWRKRKLQKIGDEKLVASQIQGYISGRNTFRFILMALALSAIIIGWANLRAGDKSEKAERKGVDVIVALDVSKSMLAKDIQPDRLTRAKQLIMRLTDKMHNDRVALIIFAGRSYLQVPLTVDYTSVKMLLQNVSPDMVPAQGTVIGDAITMAMQTFTQNEQKYKSLIIITDGEDHDDKAIDKTREAADAGVIVHTVGIGSPQGATLYDPDTRSVKLDENGNPVISKLNEDELRSIASAGHGTYNLLQNTDEVADKLINSLESMEQKSLGSVVYTDFTSYFQYFLFAGFLALVIEWLLPGRKKAKKPAPHVSVGKVLISKSVDTASSADTAVKAGAAAVFLFMFLALGANGQTNQYILQGNKLYEQQKYKEAADDYAKAVAKDPNNTSGLFNLGNSLYQQKKYDDSRKVMTETAKLSKDKTGAAAANYNIGNTYMSQQKWEDAVNSYKQTLRNNPQDVDAKYNLSYAEQMMKKQQQQQQKNDKNKQDKKDKKDQKDKKDEKKDDNKDKNKDKDDKKDQDQKDDQNKDQQPQKPESQPSKLSKQQADQLLDALQQEEKKLQDKMKKEKGNVVKMQKDW